MWKRLIYISLLLNFLLVACQPFRVEPTQFQTPISLSQGQIASPENNENFSFSSPRIIATTEYAVQERMVLINKGPGEPAKQNVWIALIGDVYPYQKVTQTVITPADYREVTDEYRNQIAEFDFSKMPDGSEIQIQIQLSH